MHHLERLMLVISPPGLVVASFFSSSSLGLLWNEGGTPSSCVWTLQGSEPGTESPWRDPKDSAPHRLTLVDFVVIAMYMTSRFVKGVPMAKSL
ncbi:hypothetical protein DPMN_021196 [Dreissena polymorpha]|uniref:Secreted protein n=1 Tax=Dreissena polymorpha TaxID=45954 RepID=A0A9D4NNT3_DREPO|nr:hypothetical protein DPMN_021196 [Dreissena polymorpha]